MAKTMYDRKEFSLPELLDKSTRNASILIPNLQRPYVWMPEQISCLVDSLFRGWPFGTLLTWTVKSLGEQQEGIPSRPFFTLVDKTQNGLEKTPATRAPSSNTTDTMVLDGQQRLQSLILAFGESDGICMYDADWMKHADPSSRVRINKQNYTTASLCLDLDRFLGEMAQCGHRLRSVALHESKSIRWAVIKPDLCSICHRGGRIPLPLANSEAGGFIALKSMWAETNSEHDEEEELMALARQFVDGAFLSEERCRQFCEQHGGYEQTTKDVTKFLRRLCELKDPSLKIMSLNVTAYSESPTATPDEKQKAKQEYDDAIVGIFTRLNTAGRALTREEITFAWLKSTWNDIGIAGDNYPKAEDFVSRLKEVFTPWNVSDDDIVIRALSILWCVHDTDRHGGLLENRELLQAGIIRKMSRFLRSNADAVVEAAEKTKVLYEDGHLTTVSDSFNGVAIAWALYFTGEKARRRITQTASEHDRDNSKKRIDAIVRFFLPRWSALASWGEYWTAHTAVFLGQVSSVLSDGVARTDSSTDMDELSAGLTSLSQAVTGIVQSGAQNSLRMRLWERKVFLYRSRLEIWQGLEPNRARFRTLTFRDADGRSEGVLQVDHIVAHNAWKERIERELADGSLTIDRAASVLLEWDADEIARQKSENPQGYENYVKEHSVGFINHIGNCMLLNAGYNVSKRKEQLGDFMDRMYEFQPTTPESLRVNKGAWTAAMKLTDELVHPDRHTITEIAAAVRRRGSEIYGELERFVTNPEPNLH